MQEDNSDKNQELANQKCPFCHNVLVIKNNLLFCQKCGIFIGDPKTFTGSFANPSSIEREAMARKIERGKMKKGRIIWKIFIIIFIIGAFASIYKFKLLDFVFGINYSPVKELQAEAPFTIYLPKKIPFGYAFEKDNINLVYNKSGKINFLNIIYEKIGGGTIEITIFPIDNGFASNGKTEYELFMDISNGRNLNQISSGNQEIFAKSSELILTEDGKTSYEALAITSYNGILFEIKYNGPKWLNENEIKNIAGSLTPVLSL